MVCIDDSLISFWLCFFLCAGEEGWSPVDLFLLEGGTEVPSSPQLGLAAGDPTWSSPAEVFGPKGKLQFLGRST